MYIFCNRISLFPLTPNQPPFGVCPIKCTNKMSNTESIESVCRCHIPIFVNFTSNDEEEDVPDDDSSL